MTLNHDILELFVILNQIILLIVQTHISAW